MRLNIEDEEKDEIPPVGDGKVKEDDKGKVVLPPKVYEQPKVPEVVKEMVAIDSLVNTRAETARLHGIPIKTVDKITANSEIVQEAKAAQVMDKYGITSLATAKLMRTLDLLQPEFIDKEVDKITVIAGLSKVINNLEDKGKDKGGDKVVHLHLYAPNQKGEKEYDTIEVS